MSQNRHRNRFRGRRLGEPAMDSGFTSTGYYMWDMKNEVAYPRDSYGAAVCTSAAANKKNGVRNYNGVYFDQGRCFVMLDFVDERFRHTR